jgi:hypothetical protein
MKERMRGGDEEEGVEEIHTKEKRSNEWKRRQQRRKIIKKENWKNGINEK